jgi:4-phospho-D-threonate 3-dehydrogenase / 4-phospho-D-erythronate 3-dehydrogenase
VDVIDLLISTGDPAGVGPEVCMKALKAVGRLHGIRLVPVGDFRVLEEAAALAGYASPLNKIDSLDSPARSPGAERRQEVLHVEGGAAVKRGTVSAEAGEHVFRILATCSQRCLKGEAAGLVTGPVNKESLAAAGHGGMGHTELLSRLAGVSSVETVFFLEGLHIFFLTRHCSLREALGSVRKDAVLSALVRMDRVMKTLGRANPRLGVAGLNPHCGEGGLFGTEEVEEILPAVTAAREQGLDVEGPIGADSIFHMGFEGAFHAILSLVHDQGHIAAKTRDFHATVTLTLGLPYLRTSVDHGTGFDIAWQGKANPESMIRAIELAVEWIRGGASPQVRASPSFPKD